MENITISKPNAKGQVVIPKKIRDALGINAKMFLRISKIGDGVFMHPIADTHPSLERDSEFLRILKETQGAWAGDDWDRQAARRRKIELAASRRRKKAW